MVLSLKNKIKMLQTAVTLPMELSSGAEAEPPESTEIISTKSSYKEKLFLTLTFVFVLFS